MKLNQQPDIIRRLRCASGHLNAVIRMAEAGEPCEQVIHQLAAVAAAIRAAELKTIICQAQSSEAIILDSPLPEQRSIELKRLQSLYTILIQNSHQDSEISYD